ncbi:MAG: hypothetical protein KAX30_08360 [Candidatus Atribacteria bacterium]|nr:hypothetical protein [Candidatus Atribacteria bacterium]
MSIGIAIVWTIGIFVIWIPQTTVDLSNIRIDPFAFSPRDILMAYLTVLAFLPAVTLTAATIAAGSYSYKVLEFFRRNFYFWTLIILYLSIILVAIGLIIFSVRQTQLLLSFQLSAILGLVFLIPYFQATFRSINFQEIIRRFANQLNRETLVPHVFKRTGSLNPPPKDPFFPLRDFMIKSLNQRDIDSFTFVLGTYTDAVITITKELSQRPQESHPLYGKNIWDKRMGKNAAEQLWTHSTVQKISERVFSNHLHSIQEEAFHQQNEEGLIELVSALGRLGLETWQYLKPLREPFSKQFGTSSTYMISEIGNRACEDKMLDLLAQCLDTLHELGIFWAKYGPKSEMHNLSGHCQKNAKDLFETFMTSKKWSYYDYYFIIPRAIQTEIGIFSQRLIHRPYGIYSNDFSEVGKIQRIANKIPNLGMNMALEVQFQHLLIPILLQMEMNGGDKAIKKMADFIGKTFISPYEILLDSFKTIIDRFHNKEISWQRYYTNHKPRDWYRETLRILENILKDITQTKGSGYPEVVLSLYQTLLIVWIRMQNWVRVSELIKKIAIAHQYLKEEKSRVVVNNPVELLDRTAYTLLAIGQKDEFLACLSNLQQIAFSDRKEAPQISRKIVLLGLYASKWNREYEKETILRTLVSLATIPPQANEWQRHTTIQLRLLAIIGGFGEARDFIHEMNHNIEEAPFLYKILDKGERESVSQEIAKAFLKEYTVELIKLAHNTGKYVAKNLKWIPTHEDKEN